MLRHEPPGLSPRGSPVSVATTSQPASAAASIRAARIAF
jgi:hypothetical protein